MVTSHGSLLKSSVSFQDQSNIMLELQENKFCFPVYLFLWSLNFSFRRFYHITSFYLFFFNVVLGFFSCLRRLLMSMVFGLILISRLDRCLLMRGFERFDTGKLPSGSISIKIFAISNSCRFNSLLFISNFCVYFRTNQLRQTIGCVLVSHAV